MQYKIGYCFAGAGRDLACRIGLQSRNGVTAQTLSHQGPGGGQPGIPGESDPPYLQAAPVLNPA
eukprot:366227-Chlamydomonas_euryale.AAC.22